MLLPSLIQVTESISGSVVPVKDCERGDDYSDNNDNVFDHNDNVSDED